MLGCKGLGGLFMILVFFLFVCFFLHMCEHFLGWVRHKCSLCLLCRYGWLCIPEQLSKSLFAFFSGFLDDSGRPNAEKPKSFFLRMKCTLVRRGGSYTKSSGFKVSWAVSQSVINGWHKHAYLFILLLGVFQNLVQFPK